MSKRYINSEMNIQIDILDEHNEPNNTNNKKKVECNRKRHTLNTLFVRSPISIQRTNNRTKKGYECFGL